MFTRVGTLPALVFTLLIAVATAAGAQLASPSSTAAEPGSTAIPPGAQVNHVFIVMEENHRYDSVIGNPDMPYLNSLAKTYSLAQGYFANTHPSIGNYFMLTTGQIITNDDSYHATVTVDNVVRELLAAGKTWKEYSEGHTLSGVRWPQHRRLC